MIVRVRAMLERHADPANEAFSGALIPDHMPMLGVRLPVLRNMARELARGGCDYLDCGDKTLFEERMLEGMILGYAPIGYAEWESRMRGFVTRIADWSVNDSTAATQKIVAKHRDEAWGFLAECVASEAEFTVRFGIVMLMDWYLTDEWIDRVLDTVTAIGSQAFYVRTAVAWCLATALAKFPEGTFAAIARRKPDALTQKILLRKARESRRVSADSVARLASVLSQT